MTRSRFIRLLAALCACAALPAQATISLADITAQLRRQPEPAGTFTQTRYLRGMNRPLIASGRFALQQGILYWNLEKPFASSLRITADGVSQWQDGGWQHTDAAAADDAQTRLFLTFFSADEATLNEYFSITAGGETAAWTLQLLPKAALMRQVFTRIDIRGGAYVEQVTLEEAQGDKSELRFHIEQ